MNLRIIIGNLTRDPDMSYIVQKKDGEPLACTKFTVASNDWDQSTKSNVALFTNVVLFGKRAETTYEWLKKGSKVLVIGKHSERKYTDKDGVNKVWVEVKVDEIEFLSGFKTRDEVHGYVPDESQGPVSDEVPF